MDIKKKKKDKRKKISWTVSKYLGKVIECSSFHCHEETHSDVIIQYIPEAKALFELSSLA